MRFLKRLAFAVRGVLGAGTLLLGASCSWIPGATVRVAVAPADTEAHQLWAQVSGVEVVPPGAFPPPDLIWFDTTYDSGDFAAKALGFNAEIETLARSSGLAPGWVTDSGERILPVFWSPWAWWLATDRGPAALPGRPLIPYQDRANLRALTLATLKAQGPVVGDPAALVWTTWGTRARDEGKTLGVGQALARWPRGPYDRLWLNWAELATRVPEFPLIPEPATVAPVRVRGVWWNADGWDRQQVAEVLARLWSPEVQSQGTREAGWLPVNRRVPLPTAGARIEAWGEGVREFVLVQSPANE